MISCKPNNSTDCCAIKWQSLIDVCVDELDKIDIFIIPGKCTVLWIGPRFAKFCAPVSLQGNAVKYCEKAKYLGVTVCSRSKFSVDVSCMKAKFYKCFNSLFHKASKFHDDLVMLHLVSFYCQPKLTYATECLGLTVT